MQLFFQLSTEMLLNIKRMSKLLYIIHKFPSQPYPMQFAYIEGKFGYRKIKPNIILSDI